MLLFSIVTVLYVVFRIAVYFRQRKIEREYFKMREEAIRRDAESRVNTMPIEELVERANTRWKSRKSSKNE